MKEFSGRIAVVTGGGSGMGRELVRLLVAEGCHVAMCDVSMHGMAETRRQCEATGLPQGLRVTSHLADVSNEADVMRFRDEAANQHATDRIHLLFNNAGIGGGGSMVANSRDEWERTFNICWFGVYYSTRAFLPMMLKADRGHIVNTSSVNGFWASIGPAVPHTAYCAAKFALEGWTEALQPEVALFGIHTTIVNPGFFRTELLTQESTTYAEPSIADYAERHAARRAWYEAQNGQQSGDPAKLAQALIMIAGQEPPPRRFIAGADAIATAEQKVADLKAQIDAERDLSTSLDFDQVGSTRHGT